MEKESDVLRIVKEDILEVLKEKNGEVPLLLIEPEIKVSRSFISKAIRELGEESLIQIKKDLICLTEEGMKRGERILGKHLILEDYFRKIRSKKEAYKAASILEHYVSMEVIDNIKKLSTFKKEGVPLTECELNRENLITDIDFPIGGLFERVVSMGILPGEKIRIMYKIPDGFVVNVSHKKITLGKDIAKKIKVVG